MTQVFKGKQMSYPLPWGGKPEQNVRMYIYTYGEGGRMAIQLTVPSEDDSGFQEPFMTCTVNLPDEECSANEAFIKDWSENEGCAEWLIKQGVLERKPTAHVTSGYVTVARYRFTAAFLMEAAAALTDGKRVLKKSQRGDSDTAFIMIILCLFIGFALTSDFHNARQMTRIESKLNLMTCSTDSECESACKEAKLEDCEERYNPK